jgi:hypothetical protein
MISSILVGKDEDQKVMCPRACSILQSLNSQIRNLKKQISRFQVSGVREEKQKN